MRAPTPSAAAELAAPSVQNLYDRIDVLERRCEKSVLAQFDKAVDRFTALNARLAAQSPENRLKLGGTKLDELDSRIELAFARYIERQYARLGESAARLDSLSPLKVLSRGYSLVYSGEHLLSGTEKLNVGDEVEIRFGNGGAKAEITEKW